jgi:hypothetical protein
MKRGGSKRSNDAAKVSASRGVGASCPVIGQPRALNDFPRHIE